MKIDVIPNRLEKYMELFLNKNVVFIDSMQFMNPGLDKLARNLTEGDFKYLTEEFGFKNLELLKQKDAYPYEYMDSFKRLGEEKLPDEECFYSSVKDGTTGENSKKLDGHISDEDYLMCKKIWNKFNMKNMGDYHGYYLGKDVLLLADIFEKFIVTCLKFYGMDLCHYFSSPGLSWCKIRKNCRHWDVLIHWKGLRGGVSYIAKKYAKENNKYIKDYDPKNPSKFITFLDMNNLYGWAMSGYLPYDGFKWLKTLMGLM